MKHQSLESALAVMTREESLTRDFLIPRTALNTTYNVGEFGSSDPRINFSSKKNGEETLESMKLTEWAHAQLAGKLDIPIKYYNKMKSQEHQLFIDNVNTWLHKPKMGSEAKDDRLLIRSMDNNVRGVLSTKYKPIANKQVTLVALQTLAELQEQKKIQFNAREIVTNDTNIYLKFTSNNGFMMEPIKQDIWYPGVMIRNSEVGASKFQVDVYTWRQWCKNGAIISNGLSKVHLGKTIKGDGEIQFSEKTEELNIAAMMSAMKDIIKQVFIPEQMNLLLERIKRSQNVLIGNPKTAVKLIAKRYKLSELEEKSVLDRFRGNTQYDLGNAVTELARDTPGEARQIELEEIGGEILLFEGVGFRMLPEAQGATA